MGGLPWGGTLAREALLSWAPITKWLRVFGNKHPAGSPAPFFTREETDSPEVGGGG